VIKAIEDIFENEETIQLYYFHLNQFIWRKVQELGLAIKYKENKQFKQAVKLISALAFLPVNIIKKVIKYELLFNYFYYLLLLFILGMSILYDTINYNDDVNDILTYFDATYVNGNYKATTTEFETMYLSRQPPIFSPHLWSVYNASKKGCARTNNISEAFNNKF